MKKPLTGTAVRSFLNNWDRGTPCSKAPTARVALTQIMEERDVLLAVHFGGFTPEQLPQPQAEIYKRLQDEAGRIW